MLSRIEESGELFLFYLDSGGMPVKGNTSFGDRPFSHKQHTLWSTNDVQMAYSALQWMLADSMFGVCWPPHSVHLGQLKIGELSAYIQHSGQHALYIVANATLVG